MHLCMPALQRPDRLIPLRGIRAQVSQKGWGITLYRYKFQGLRQFREKYRGWQRKTGLGRPGSQVSDPFPGRHQAQVMSLPLAFGAESEEELKSLLRKVKEESEKVSLKLNIQKTNIVASSPITSWQRNGETVETASNFILGGSKITADGECSHEIKRHVLLGRSVMTNLDSIFKSRDITLPAKEMATHSSILAWKSP